MKEKTKIKTKLHPLEFFIYLSVRNPAKTIDSVALTDDKQTLSPHPSIKQAAYSDAFSPLPGSGASSLDEPTSGTRQSVEFSRQGERRPYSASYWLVVLDNFDET